MSPAGVLPLLPAAGCVIGGVLLVGWALHGLARAAERRRLERCRLADRAVAARVSTGPSRP